MARTNSILLDKGDKFPEIEMKLVSGETVRLPGATGEGYGVVLFYRGYW
jgi:peroxiredoxin